jgi:hypothetical protein
MPKKARICHGGNPLPARPGWKSGMLGHHLGLSGFEQDGVDDVRVK